MTNDSLTDITEIYSNAEKAWLSENYALVRSIIANGKTSEISVIKEDIRQQIIDALKITAPEGPWENMCEVRANTVMKVINPYLCTMEPVLSVDADMAMGALEAIHALLDDGGIPRGTFADDHVRNLVALYNQRGGRIAELEAKASEQPDELPPVACPITPASLKLHQELFDLGRKHERESSVDISKAVKIMLRACEGLEDLEDCMTAAFAALDNNYRIEVPLSGSNDGQPE